MIPGLENLTEARHFGETLALASGFIWAIAVILFRVSGRHVHPLALNFFKNVFSLPMVVLTLVVLGEPFLVAGSGRDDLLLLLSGVLGIAVSDTLFLTSLNLLGAALAGIVETFYSPFVIALSVLFLGERMTLSQLGGVALIVLAVLIISREDHAGTVARRDLRLGIGLGILAMLFVGVGIVMIKPLLAHVSLIRATGVRLVGGAVPLGLVLLAHPRRRELLGPLLVPANWKALAPGSILGAYISLIVWLGGMRYTFVSVAAALNQLNTVFIFILAVVFLREKVTPTKLAAVVLAFIGAYLASTPL
jgi:drug/metabolite transporter (DMT)-like permease